MQAPLISYSNWSVSMDWSEEEQRILEAHMARFPSDTFDPVQRYVRIAQALPRKSIRDVALRVRWTTVQQQLKRRAMMDSLAGKQQQQQGAAAMMAPMPPRPPMMPMQASQAASVAQAPIAQQPYIHPAPMPAPPPVAPEGPPTVDGPVAALLDANMALINQFKANMASFKVHENTQLLVQFRDNILQVINCMETMGGVMGQMPQLPVRLNVDLANNFLPSRPVGVLSYDGGVTLLPPPQPAINAPGMVPLNGYMVGGMQQQQQQQIMQQQQQQQVQAGMVPPPGMIPDMQQQQQQVHMQQANNAAVAPVNGSNGMAQPATGATTGAAAGLPPRPPPAQPMAPIVMPVIVKPET